MTSVGTMLLPMLSDQPMSSVRHRTPLIGCVGPVKDSGLTDRFLDALAHETERLGCEGSVAKSGNLTVQVCGEIAEFPTLVRSVGGLHEADVFLRLGGYRPGLQCVQEIASWINYSQYGASLADKSGVWIFGEAADAEISPAFYVTDLRKTLGAIFWYPRAEAWRKTVEIVPSMRAYIPPETLIIHMPNLQVWHLPLEGNVRKYKIAKSKYYTIAQESQSAPPPAHTQSTISPETT